MKYKGYVIEKVPTDLGEQKLSANYTYKIFKDGEYITTALTLSTAKEYISNGCDENYL